MQIAVTNELRQICEEIAEENLSVEQWAEIESSDMFQTATLCGGFEATERLFTFSWCSSKDEEYWFDLSLEEIEGIVRGVEPEISARLADR